MTKTQKIVKDAVGEVQVQKSPAEFFAENQSIAGFDNLGKSLYTSLRELVENGLDACESIQVLPNIRVEVTEYTQKEFNTLVGMGDSPRRKHKDSELFEEKKKGRKSLDANSASKDKISHDIGSEKKGEKPDAANSAAEDPSKQQQQKKDRRARSTEAYFMLKVRDNGCGMKHDDIPELLGRVLSGSKYGVRQTRGKFGLGAKMALIWSKKSTGQPIRITSAHATNNERIPSHVSTCVLDIDIYKNSPKIVEHTKEPNKDGWRGTEMQVLIAGNWTTYKSRIVQYMQQLAIITPYAELELHYRNKSEPKLDMALSYDRRSEQMPPPAKQVKHHPSSVNNIILQQLIRITKCQRLDKFLSMDLAGVSPALSKRLLAELGPSFDEAMDPKNLKDKQITRIVQMLRQVQMFKAPDGSCLSPLGEYNLNLGIQKVIEPDFVATARDKPGAYEGHPFVIEAAVSLGGNKNVREGITVVRFANRIPLLFEGGADVSTRVANSKIRWNTYKIDHKKDKVGVFVSIVSTKIPFKGTSKEYIGDDATEIQQSVKRALQLCCQQLRIHLSKRNALKDAKERKARLFKYVPDVGRSLYGLLDGMKKRREEEVVDLAPSSPVTSSVSPAVKRLRPSPAVAQDIIERLERGEISEAVICERLKASIDDHLETEETEGQDGAKNSKGKKMRGVADNAVPVFLVPIYNLNDDQFDVHGSFFTFRPILPIVSDASTNGM